MSGNAEHYYASLRTHREFGNAFRRYRKIQPSERKKLSKMPLPPCRFGDVFARFLKRTRTHIPGKTDKTRQNSIKRTKSRQSSAREKQIGAEIFTAVGENAKFDKLMSSFMFSRVCPFSILKSVGIATVPSNTKGATFMTTTHANIHLAPLMYSPAPRSDARGSKLVNKYITF